ncbi:MAG TPA: hypothetical protein VFS25_15700, partial [Chitinophaga sp.]|uniref:hypothetical protein n=1 Tax=Chitinophaga sp. TaxID=1869181 RepID=UPI002DB8BD91
ENRYNIDLHKTFTLNMQEFYVVFLQFSLNVQGFNYNPDPSLLHLQNLLKLKQEEIAPFHITLGEEFFRDAVLKTIKNGRYSNDDHTRLETLAHALKLPLESAAQISLELRQEYVHKHMASIFKHKRLSAEGKHTLMVLEKNMAVEILKDDAIQKQLQTFEYYWRIENEPLPKVLPEIPLTKSEICHCRIKNVFWYEDRSVGRGRYESKLIERGILHLTNKQLIFTGSEKTSKIRLEKIIKITRQQQGIQILKTAGKNPILDLGKDSEVFSIIIGRLLVK